MEAFYRTHKYLVTHLGTPVRRGLMDEVDWSQRLIGIKGCREIGKTTFLLSYAREFFPPDGHECLYVNLNNFIFTERTLTDFAGQFYAAGGKVLLIDQIFKYPDWSRELRYCYDHYTHLRIVFTGSSVMRIKEENHEVGDIVTPYYLRGFSFREYLNLKASLDLQPFTFDDLMSNRTTIARDICAQVNPGEYFHDYLHHGFYPFFLEKRNYSENLLKMMNMTLEVDVLYIRQIEQRYLPKLRRLLYLISQSASCIVNISQLSKTIGTSRATVMNYLKYLKDARMITLLHLPGEEFPQKPVYAYMYNSNLLHVMNRQTQDERTVNEAFFFNQLLKDNSVNAQDRHNSFLVNDRYLFRVAYPEARWKASPDIYYAVDEVETPPDEPNLIPLWMFGFLY